jgi:hypothetical protein
MAQARCRVGHFCGSERKYFRAGSAGKAHESIVYNALCVGMVDHRWRERAQGPGAGPTFLTSMCTMYSTGNTNRHAVAQAMH